ncbi:MAG: ATP-binding protein, partial [Acidimicrobiia bacterium]
QLPLWGALAGLPNLLGRAAKAKTYAERMFTVAELGPLDTSAATAAIKDPAAELDVSFSAPALAAIVAASAGYPYFLQTWGYHTWNMARDDPISRADVRRAETTVRRALDDGFFAARVARVPESERRYLRALAALGPGPHTSREVAEALGTTTPGVGALRDRLMTDGVIYSPAYGQVQLAMPLLDDFLRRSR